MFVYLQDFGQLVAAVVQCDVQRVFAEFTLRVNVGAEAQQQLHHVSVAVLHGPVQRAHLQHVLGVHVGAVLQQTHMNKVIVAPADDERRHLQRQITGKRTETNIKDEAHLQQQLHDARVTL